MGAARSRPAETTRFSRPRRTNQVAKHDHQAPSFCIWVRNHFDNARTSARSLRAPSRVAVAVRASRCSKGRPNRVFGALMCRLIASGVTLSSAVAAVMPPSLTDTSKARREFNGRCGVVAIERRVCFELFSHDAPSISDAPSPERLAMFRSYRGIGIAGTAQSRSPAWMDEHLPPIFRLLSALGAPVLHYKVCSTFDSSPEIGSIGRAADIGIALLRPGWTPMIVADLGMGRYQSFGHLFAAAGGVGYRLDRHPTMSRHPTTPMDEADLSHHLARQTRRRSGLVDFVAMKHGLAEQQLDAALQEGAEIVSLDVMDRETQAEAGRLVWERGGRPVFGIGSQGFEAALVAYWRESGLLPTPDEAARAGEAARIACVSGSVSPVTADQIAFALAHGFEGARLALPRREHGQPWHIVLRPAQVPARRAGPVRQLGHAWQEHHGRLGRHAAARRYLCALGLYQHRREELTVIRRSAIVAGAFLVLAWAGPSRADESLRVCLDRRAAAVPPADSGAPRNFDLAVGQALARKLERPLAVQWYESGMDRDADPAAQMNALLSDGRCQLVLGYPPFPGVLDVPQAPRSRLPDSDGAIPADRRRWVQLGELAASRGYRFDPMVVLLGRGPRLALSTASATFAACGSSWRKARWPTRS